MSAADKELLVLAAKAAGLAVGRCNECGLHIYTSTLGKWWSPLMDDGDALRLAVKLGLLVDCDYDLKESEAMHRGARQVVNHDADPFAATRRAITRAAAEIGRAMP